jgi:nicotinamide-nucleotide adenylyltransferase
MSWSFLVRSGARVDWREASSTAAAQTGPKATMAEEQSDMRRQVTKFAAALSSFSSSADNFRILASIPQNSPPPSTLYVLDSSFNPPTLAHLRIATSALSQDHGRTPKRLLLLLATQNADKAPKPASFEQRLTLMTIFANDLRGAYISTSSARSRSSSTEEAVEDQPAIDIGVTKHPIFVDKASAIEASGFYPPDTTQVHLTGYDTLIRILNPKYYPPTHTLAPLEPFLSKHRLRVTYRTDDDWGGRAEQEAYLKALADGERDAEGGRRDWAGRIELVEGRREGEEVVSSTRVREAVKSGDGDILRKLVSEGVADWVLQERLYADD